MRTGRPTPAPFPRKLDPIERAIKRFTLFAWRVRFGWALLLVVGGTLSAIGIGVLVTFPALPELVHQAVIYMLILAWVCLGLLTGMFRRALRGRALLWAQLTAVGKLARVAVTALGTAVMLAPFG